MITKHRVFSFLTKMLAIFILFLVRLWGLSMGESLIIAILLTCMYASVLAEEANKS